MSVFKGQFLALKFMLAIAAMQSILTACASSTYDRLQERRDQNNSRAAGYAADGFTMDFRSPEPRPVRAWLFYYKNCSLVSRNPYPNKSEFECADPR